MLDHIALSIISASVLYFCPVDADRDSRVCDWAVVGMEETEMTEKIYTIREVIPDAR